MVEIQGKRCRTIESIPEDVRNRLMEMNDPKINWALERYDELQKILNDHCESIRWIVVHSGQGVVVTQRFKIEQKHLETKDVVNDTLLTDGAPIPFVWNIAPFKYSISVGFGESVEPWIKLNDLNHNILAHRIETVAGVKTVKERHGICLSIFDEPTKLQRFEWDSDILKPYAWTIGQTVDLEQIVIPSVTLP